MKGAKLLFPPVQQPHLPVYFGGSSPAAHDLAAEQVETYLTWGEPRPRSPRRWPMCAPVPPSTAAP